MCQQNLLRAHDNELEQLTKQYRQMQEKLATAQLQECKTLQKKVKMDQVSFLLLFPPVLTVAVF
jgi:Polo kinase kinase